MREFYLGVKFAISYFTNFPMEFGRGDNLSTKGVLGAMLFFLPFVGVILGGVVVLIYLTLSKLGWYSATISAILYMMLYGFLHTEAIIDIVDAIYAKHGGKDPYKIIKESTVGAIGVLYGVGFTIMKIVGIVYLLTHELFREFVAILLISRLSLVILIDTLDFKSTFVTKLKESLKWYYLLASFLLSILVGSIITPLFIPLILFGILFSFFVAIYIGKKLGFINGDVLGFTLEMVEILLILVVSNLL